MIQPLDQTASMVSERISGSGCGGDGMQRGIAAVVPPTRPTFDVVGPAPIQHVMRCKFDSKVWGRMPLRARGTIFYQMERTVFGRVQAMSCRNTNTDEKCRLVGNIFPLHCSKLLIPAVFQYEQPLFVPQLNPHRSRTLSLSHSLSQADRFTKNTHASEFPVRFG